MVACIIIIIIIIIIITVIIAIARHAHLKATVLQRDQTCTATLSPDTDPLTFLNLNHYCPAFPVLCGHVYWCSVVRHERPMQVGVQPGARCSGVHYKSLLGGMRHQSAAPSVIYTGVMSPVCTLVFWVDHRNMIKTCQESCGWVVEGSQLWHSMVCTLTFKVDPCHTPLTSRIAICRCSRSRIPGQHHQRHRLCMAQALAVCTCRQPSTMVKGTHWSTTHQAVAPDLRASAAEQHDVQPSTREHSAWACVSVEQDGARKHRSARQLDLHLYAKLMHACEGKNSQGLEYKTWESNVALPTLLSLLR
jgi:hypothetical protein